MIELLRWMLPLTGGPKKETNMTDKNTQPAAIPAGFTAMGAVNIDGYFEPQAGAVVQGILIGRFTRTSAGPDGKFGEYYQIRLTHPCTAAVAREKDAKGKKVSLVLNPGQILFMDERKATEGLADLAEDLNWSVFVSCGARVDIKGGKTFWPMNVGAMEASADQMQMSHPRK